jgi:hypothetical protein
MGLPSPTRQRSPVRTARPSLSSYLSNAGVEAATRVRIVYVPRGCSCFRLLSHIASSLPLGGPKPLIYMHTLRGFPSRLACLEAGLAG